MMSIVCDFDPTTLPELLPIYYRRIFPLSAFFRWMSYGKDDNLYFTRREFSFTLKDDVYIRYLSFADQKELEKEILKKCPYKIDIGAVFSHRPKLQKTVKAGTFVALEKELVFDIDMTDYDDIRNCCGGADICLKCWPLMTHAVKILDRALRDDFGFRDILWVYSGRRGVHCWVCDEKARVLSQSARTAIVDYLTLIEGGDNLSKKVSLPIGNLHSSVGRAVDLIDEGFDCFAVDAQNFLCTEEQLEKLLSLLPDDSLRQEILLFLSDYEEEKKTSRNRWETIKKFILHSQEAEGRRKLMHVLSEIKLQHCYPRLDVNVSKGVNHLLKSPFSVHPKTGRICIPLDVENIDDFNPFNAPTISEVCAELDSKGRIAASVQLFERFVERLLSRPHKGS